MNLLEYQRQMTRGRWAGCVGWMLLAAAWTVVARSAIDTHDGRLPDLPPAAGRFLVATPLMERNYFRGSVIFLASHGSRGTLGLIVNRPLFVDTGRLAPEAPLRFHDLPVHEGGPVQPGMLSLMVRETASGRQQGWLRFLFGTVQSLRLLSVLGRHSEPMLFSGYCGWAPGQLEAEILRGAWHVVPADDELIFDTDAELLWMRLQRRLHPLAE